MQKFAVVTTKSFGDFVIAHAVLHSVEASARNRVRLIACSHVRELGAILSDDLRVTFLALREDRVPAIFDVRKRGISSAVESALWLRRALRRVPREPGESLAFDGLGLRERLIAGDWPTVALPRSRNIYETYSQFLAGRGIPTREAKLPQRSRAARSVGIFPESRLAAKTLDTATLSTIVDQAARAGLQARLMLLDGDPSTAPTGARIVRVQKNFKSLAAAIESVDCVVSADSLPAHLGEYLAKPVFVAAAFPNEYWLPRGCYTGAHWGLFPNPVEFCTSLGRFFRQSATGKVA